MPRIAIDSLDDPRIEPYRHLTTTNLTRWSGRFIAEGKRVVERLLDSDFPVESVLLSERREAELFTQFPAMLPVYVLPQKLAEGLLGYNFHSGVLACGIRKPPPDLSSRLDGAVRAGDRVTLVVCPNINDPENLGALVRLGAAFAVDALLLGRGSADPFSRRVLRVSMGTAFRLPILECSDLHAALVRLRDQLNVQLAATVLDESAERLAAAHRPQRLALLFGNEAEGLDRRWIELCDRRITIPMQGSADSLNVAVAAGIILHHFTSNH
jgi:tRNA G18 (ribose-2'-O)-methylase SpoU